MKDSSRTDARFIDAACHDPEFISVLGFQARRICHRRKLPRPKNHRRSCRKDIQCYRSPWFAIYLAIGYHDPKFTDAPEGFTKRGNLSASIFTTQNISVPISTTRNLLVLIFRGWANLSASSGNSIDIYRYRFSRHAELARNAETSYPWDLSITLSSTILSITRSSQRIDIDLYDYAFVIFLFRRFWNLPLSIRVTKSTAFSKNDSFYLEVFEYRCIPILCCFRRPTIHLIPISTMQKLLTFVAEKFRETQRWISQIILYRYVIL